MPQLIRSRRFALVELISILICGAVWMVKPEWGLWFILIALFPLILKILFGEFLSRRIVAFDWLVLVFLITAWVGYWAAYDQVIAWNKVWLIVTSVLLYYSLSTQPRENLVWVAIFFFCVGVGVSIYYFLMHDFVAAPRKLGFVNGIGRWIMSIRPQTGWTPIHPNYVAGTIALTVPFIIYPVWKFKRNNDAITLLSYTFILAGLGLAGIALLMATSRGVVLAIFSGVGAWLLWRLVNSSVIRRQIKSEAVFPILLLIYLVVIVAFIYVGPARSGGVSSGNYYFGNGSRAELFSRSLYLLLDYPITGGGLGSFPGLYSQYLLGIPFFNVPNSHNLFLDVGIEQGILGGLSFLFLYLSGLWSVSKSIVEENENLVFKWIILFSLVVAIVHGVVDDYLYNGVGSTFSLFLVGLSVNEKRGDKVFVEKRPDIRSVILVTVVCVVAVLVNFNRIRGAWYANLGAVQLAKVELNGFPNTGWAGQDIVPKLDGAASTLHSSLQFDPANRTANHRLGLISMSQLDFRSAAFFLERARIQAPNHRGIIKSLGYCYAWLGDMEKAQVFLSQIPEAYDELDVYTRWWESQGRSDLSKNAALAVSVLKTSAHQP